MPRNSTSHLDIDDILEIVEASLERTRAKAEREILVQCENLRDRVNNVIRAVQDGMHHETINPQILSDINESLRIRRVVAITQEESKCQ